VPFPLPDVPFTDSDGAAVRAAALLGRPALIDVALPGCARQADAEDALADIRKRAAADGVDDFAIVTVVGVGYALLLDNRRSSSGMELGRGLAYGVATWFVGSWGLLPALGAKRPPWRNGWRENAVDFVAHGLFGAVAALVSGEMRRQDSRVPTPDAVRYLARSG
jgi:hypothetical protein